MLNKTKEGEKSVIFLKVKLIFITLLLMLNACSSLKPINDFFGIQMNPSEEQNFRIIHYDEINGVTYKNSLNMNPNINAWAEIRIDDIRIKIVNNSETEIPLNYITDEYVIITNDQDFILDKGDRLKYSQYKNIKANSSVELFLNLPQNFNMDFTYKYYQNITKHMLQDFDKLGYRKNIFKENTKYILIKLGDRKILLKTIPQANTI